MAEMLQAAPRAGDSPQRFLNFLTRLFLEAPQAVALNADVPGE